MVKHTGKTHVSAGLNAINEALESVKPEQHAALGAQTPSAAMGKPADITADKQAALDALAAQTRETMKDSAINTPNPDSLAKVEYVPNEIEKSLFKLGLKSARRTSADSVFSINTASMADLMVKGLFVAFKGIDTSKPIKSLIEINLATLATLVTALPAHTPRKAGESTKWVRTTTINAASVDQGDTTNKIALVDVTGNVITLASGVTLKHAALPVIAFGKTDVKNADKRFYYFVDVTFADGTNEVIKSFWLDGLLSAINARKAIITSDHFTSAEKYDTRKVTSTPINTGDNEDESESESE